MGWGVADIPVANGTVLIGPISAIPGAFIRKTDVMATRRVLHLVRHSSAAMQELRREWAAISLLTMPERMTDDQLIQHVDYGVARRTLAVMLIARDQSNFVARPAEKPRLIQPESVADWTASEKIVAALRASGGHLGGEMRRMIEELIDPVNVAVTVGLILALVAANAMGWGVIADAVLVIFAYAAAGIAGIKAIGQFIETTIDVIDARSAGEIDQAGKEYAHAFRVLGTAFLARFLGKAKAKRAGATERVPRGGSAKPAAKPSAKPPPAQSKPVQTQRPPQPAKPGRQLTDAQKAAHLSKFEEGVAKVVPKETLDKYGGVVGPPSGTYVFPKSHLDKLVREANGDVGKLERLLSLEPGTLGKNPMIVSTDAVKGLRFPSGTESGANADWIPGGFTKGGVPEAIVDQIQKGAYTVVPFLKGGGG